MRKGLILAMIVTAMSAPEVLACSGPGALEAIFVSEVIGWWLLGVSCAITLGMIVLLRRHPSKLRRAWWPAVALAIHPGYWMSATHGDCGDTLVSTSFIATVLIACLATLTIALPSHLGRRNTHGDRSTTLRDRFRFRLRTLLLLPVALAILLTGLFSTHRFEVDVGIPHTFIIVDKVTQQPIPGASVQPIHPDIPASLQSPPIITGPTGEAWMMLFASEWGRQGLLGSTTEGIRFGPELIKVEAPGHRPFMAPSGKLIPGWKYPPPAATTISLERIAKGGQP